MLLFRVSVVQVRCPWAVPSCLWSILRIELCCTRVNDVVNCTFRFFCSTEFNKFALNYFSCAREIQPKCLVQSKLSDVCFAENWSQNYFVFRFYIVFRELWKLFKKIKILNCVRLFSIFLFFAIRCRLLSYTDCKCTLDFISDGTKKWKDVFLCDDKNYFKILRFVQQMCLFFILK